MGMKIVSRQIVKPAEPTWSGILPLTELDHVSVITHSSNLHFYEKPTEQCWLNSSNNKILNTLKESLSRILIPFYPLAGRLSWVGGGRQRLVLKCNAMGAEIIDVESSMKIADFGDFYSSSDKFKHLVPQIDYFGTQIQDIPLLVVQLTRFVCGGLSVGISLSHMVVDGRSAFHFIDEWARLTRGEPMQVAPFLDRRILQAEDVNLSQTTQVFDDDENQLTYFNTLEGGKLETPTFVFLTKDKIERLKEVANNKDGEINSDNRRSFSRFEVITSHVWRCVCKARELKCDEITSLFVLVNARGRVDPPLPSSYFGNAVVQVTISSSVGDLISKPLSYICSTISEASTKVNNEYVYGFLDVLKTEESLTMHQYTDDRGTLQGPPYGEHNIMATSWLSLMAMGVDFGWGKEIYNGPPLVRACDGEVMIIPYNDGSVVVGVFLKPKEKFQEYMNLI
ncbi:hypothetical protein SOVF_194020 [Spinacia oleracea]|nr:hypothetical protein SOVF_194020 [Spinacia oleracea]